MPDPTPQADPVDGTVADRVDDVVTDTVRTDTVFADTVVTDNVVTPRRIDLRLALTVMLGVAGGLLLAELLGGVVERLQGLLVTVLISLFLSFAISPGVQYFERRGWRRGPATGLIFVVVILGIIGFFAAMAPLVIGQLTTLVEDAPRLLTTLSERARDLPGGLGESVSSWLLEMRESLPERLGSLAGGLLSLGATVLGGLLQMLTILLITFYLVADERRLKRVVFARLEPESQVEVDEVWDAAIAKTGGYVYGRALVAVASAIFHSVVFQVMGLDFAIALGVWVGVVSSLIPVVGTYLAGALPLLIALVASPVKAIFVALAVVVYQQIENYVVAPRITAKTMELHPAVAFLSVLVGGALLGAVGALLALPAAAIIAGIIGAVGERHQVVVTDDSQEPGEVVRSGAIA